MQNVWESMKSEVKQIFRDWKKLFTASKSTVAFLLAAEVLFGLLFVFELHIFAHIIDALIGARGIGVWTADLNKGIIWQVIALSVWAPIWYSHSMFTGLAGRIGAKIREAVFAASAFTFSIVAAPFYVILLAAGLPFIRTFNNRIISLLYSAGVVAVTAKGVSNLAALTIAKSISIGQFILWGGALLGFCAWAAVRPHLQSNS